MLEAFTLRHRRTWVVGTVFAATGVVLVGCGGGAAKVSIAVGRSPAAATAATVVEMVSPRYGLILTTVKGFALYTYTADRPGGPGCSGSCLELWPPLLLSPGVTDPVAGPAVGPLGSIARAEGFQVTYQGQPLYTYLDDRQPAQITGQGVVDTGGTWLLAAITAPTAGSLTTAPGASAPRPGATGAAPTRPPAISPPTTRPAGVPGPVTTSPPTDVPVTAPPPTPAPTVAPTTAPTTTPTTAPAGGPSY